MAGGMDGTAHRRDLMGKGKDHADEEKGYKRLEI